MRKSLELSSFRAECNEVEKSVQIDLFSENSGLRSNREDEFYIGFCHSECNEESLRFFYEPS